MTGNGQVASRVLVVEPRASLAALIVGSLNASGGVAAEAPSEPGSAAAVAAIASGRYAAIVYSPLDDRARDLVPDLDAAGEILPACARSGAWQVVLVSSAAAYGADYHNPGLIRESRPTSARCPNLVAEAWRAVEALAARHSGESGPIRLAILRPAMTRVEGANDWVNRLLRRRWAVTVAGYSPSIQIVESDDLARAIGLAVEAGAEGVFNIAPDGVVPLRQALRSAGVRRIPLPWSWQRLGRAALRRLGASSGDQQEYLRYSWTVSNERSRSVLGMRYDAPSHGSVRFDDFGMDEHFIRVRGRRGLEFMNRRYWRIEARGLEHIPREGRAVLVGVHRGFMPFDGVMMVHLLEKHLGRIPRFLIHPGLVKFPVLAPFLTNLGGIIACQENADYVLERDEILGIFPEGIRGAFRMYRDAYTLDRFGRSDFVKMALRHRAPIVPFVFLGTAETFPILGRIEWSWWKRSTEWPFIPITPTFPLLPVPLPTKWHLQVLPPLVVPEADDPEAADDPRLVRRIGDEVRDRMQQALDAMRTRRRSLFFGSIFDDEGTAEEPVARPALDVPLTATSLDLETTGP